MKPDKPKIQVTSRISRHRGRVAASGGQRVKVTVPFRHASLVKAIAGVLRSGGSEAEHVRRSLQSVLTARSARTGAELVSFFRASPLTETDLSIERDRSTGRSVDFG